MFMLSGCLVGPDYERPQVAPPAAWQGLDPAVSGVAITSTPVAGAADLTRWWAGFNDPMLTALVERAALGNLDLTAAEARIRVARARRAIAIGGLLPTVDAFATAAHQPDFTTTDGGSVVDNTNLFAAGFDASWELDIFGKVRRRIEATDAGVQSAEFDRRDVWVTLAGEVASTYAQLRAAQTQVEIARSNLATQEDALALTTKLYDAGIVGALDVSNARAQVENTKARLPLFEASVRESIYTLGVLVGREPGTLLAELAAPGPIPAPPASVPVGLPSELLQRRPDIRRAEAELHASMALIGVAVAEQFPTFSLSAGLGTQNSSAGDFVSLATNYWSAGANMTWPLFEGGRIQANIVLQKAATDAALAAYRQRVLVALREVEVAMVNFAQEQVRRAALGRSVDASNDAVGLATELYKAGKTDFLNVLAAQRSLLDSQEALARSDQQVTNQLIALYKALGGGWELMEYGSEVRATQQGM